MSSSSKDAAPAGILRKADSMESSNKRVDIDRTARPSIKSNSTSGGSGNGGADASGKGSASKDDEYVRHLTTKVKTVGTMKSEKSHKEEPWHIRVSRIVVENKYFIVFTTLLTVYALTGDDIRLICTNKPADPIFDYLVLLCIVVFSSEVVISCLGKDDYFMGFFFILDVASTITLVLDLTWVADELAGGGEDDDSAKNARAGRTARIGAKAGRVVRVLRLVRILKLYKAIYEAKQKKKEGELNEPGDEDDWDDIDVEDASDQPETQTESRVGKKLSEMTTRRVIILVLIMLLVLPQLRPEQADQLAVSAFYGADHVWETFSTSLTSSTTTAKEDYEQSMLQYLFYHNWFAGKGFCEADQDCAGEYYSHVFWMGITGESKAEVESKAGSAQLSASAVSEWITKVKSQKDIYNYGWMPDKVQTTLSSPWTQWCDTSSKKRLGLSLLHEEIDGVIGYPVKCPSDLRISERTKYWARMQTFDEYDIWYLTFYFDVRLFSRMDAAFNLCITFFVCIVLCVASMYFSSDANNLVLKPVENMIKRVEAIRENPLIAMKMADEEFKAEEKEKAKKRKLAKERMGQFAKDIWRCHMKRQTQEPMETVILEKTIIKLGSLLALGFGEAGANIIGDNMKGADSAGVNAMVPGVRVECIIGIVRIRDFSTATEVLQAKIMTFVNQIAEIVHGVVDEYHGAANKNNGDMFLIIWRLEGMDEIRKTRMGEMSIVAFSKILGSLHSSALLAGYREHPGLQQRLGSDCRVNLNIGLHCGWAIEGAVGSEFKIDASYLSPNVSIAMSLERATQMYGISFVLAQSVQELCGEQMAGQCRLIDRVVITGSTVPIKLFAVDLDFGSLSVDSSHLNRQFAWNTRQRYRARQFLETEKTLKISPDVDIITFWVTDQVIQDMRKVYTVEFQQLFNMGYQNYSQGEWAVARRMLTVTHEMLYYEDGPSNALLRYMESMDYSSPKSWTGVRELDRHITDVI